mmetsp:Transcript_1715/g.5369  ORF Transcript_1715/g.5369 Transcript_1715/m.5369 type:complete len:205 (+) Transcript_1715:279-893(+)
MLPRTAWRSSSAQPTSHPCSCALTAAAALTGRGASSSTWAGLGCRQVGTMPCSSCSLARSPASRWQWRTLGGRPAVPSRPCWRAHARPRVRGQSWSWSCEVALRASSHAAWLQARACPRGIGSTEARAPLGQAAWTALKFSLLHGQHRWARCITMLLTCRGGSHCSTPGRPASPCVLQSVRALCLISWSTCSLTCGHVTLEDCC